MFPHRSLRPVEVNTRSVSELHFTYSGLIAAEEALLIALGHTYQQSPSLESADDTLYVVFFW